MVNFGKNALTKIAVGSAKWQNKNVKKFAKK